MIEFDSEKLKRLIDGYGGVRKLSNALYSMNPEIAPTTQAIYLWLRKEDMTTPSARILPYLAKVFACSVDCFYKE